jgi:hypothetical protein
MKKKKKTKFARSTVKNGPLPDWADNAGGNLEEEEEEEKAT